MNTIFALFSDDSKTKIVSIFTSPQPGVDGVEEIPMTDERYLDYAKRIVDPFDLMNSIGNKSGA